VLWVQSLAPGEAHAWLAAQLPPGLSAEQITAFVQAVLPNTVLPSDAAFWARVFYAEPLEMTAEARERIATAGPTFFTAAAEAAGERPELAALRAATGRKGAEFFMPLRAALTGTLHGPDLVALLAAMPAARIRERLLLAARG
jgi:glutamyl-tRNA synthetase